MDDVLDVVIHDKETVRELRLVTELMVVASLAPAALDQDVIDSALGIERAPKEFPTQRRTD
jgi:hypothetical protein